MSLMTAGMSACRAEYEVLERTCEVRVKYIGAFWWDAVPDSLDITMIDEMQRPMLETFSLWWMVVVISS